MSTPNWTTLSNGISGSVVLSGQPGYSTYRHGYNKRDELLKNPSAIVFPVNERDISVAVKFAYDNGLTLAVRSGGHSYVAASNTNGMLLHLRGYTGVTVYDNGKRASVKAGTNWGDVYYGLYASGFTLTLPTVNAGNDIVGIGMAMGGGHAARVGQHGLLCQRIRGARVVLYDGSIVECDNYKNSDLLWALKGGGAGSFGVVTELTFEPHAFERRYSIDVKFTTEHIPAAFASWQNFVANNGTTASVSGAFVWPNDAGAAAFAQGGAGMNFNMTLGISGTTAELLNYLETCGILPPGAPYITEFNSLTSIPSPGPFTEENAKFMNCGAIAGNTLNSEVVDVLLTKAREYCAGMKGLGGPYAGLSGSYMRPPNIILQCYRGAVNNDKTNSASFAYKDGLHSWQFQSDSWLNNSRTELIVQYMKDLFWAMQEKIGYRGHWNYPIEGAAATGATGYGKLYWGNNLFPLQQAKKAYDPHNFFNVPHSIPPLQ